MKIIYLINGRKYGYHKTLARDFLEVIPGEVLDMSDGTPFGQRYYELEEKDPDVIITFDLAGHDLRTGSGTLSLNNLYARMAHILFHDPDRYGRDAALRQNLSMFMYIPAKEDGAYSANLQDVPNIRSFVPVRYMADSAEEHAGNVENIKVWWERFKKDAML